MKLMMDLMSSSHGQTLFGVAKDGFDLGAGHAGEPLEKVVRTRAVLQIGEQRAWTGTRVPRKPQAPLTVPACCSTAEHLLQSSIRQANRSAERRQSLRSAMRELLLHTVPSD